MIEIRSTDLADVIEIVPKRHGDHRGWFSETWNKAAWAEAGIELDWVQDNESLSAAVGTMRGIHFQTDPHAQDKLVRVTAGRILDVAVDLRQSSSTFGEWTGVELSADTGNQLLVPKGFGHGFVTLEPDTKVAYKVSAPYDHPADAGIQALDPAIGIDWGIGTDALIISDKDRTAPLLADATHLLFS